MIRQHAHLRGIVQGVGFRPFVYREARRSGLTGWVRNGPEGVTLEVQGRRGAVRRFFTRLQGNIPQAARVDEIEVSLRPARPDERGFRIEASQGEAHARPTLPPDRAMCEECRAEVDDPGQRRHRYPFTNCTQCGPRATIVVDLPYDRARTSLASFTLCADCLREYEDPEDRRFHAEPIACPHCGPKLTLLDREGRRIAEGDAALRQVVASLWLGDIVSVLGLGGFQLLVDATNEQSVARLRRRKVREEKPLAVMFRDLSQLSHYALVGAEARRLLQGPEAPIVLLPKRAGPSVASGVAPGTDEIGALLPYTPLHHLLLAQLPMPVVCTSGNLSGEPMAKDLDEGRRSLRNVPDFWLTHDRPVVRVMDDSVVRPMTGGPMLLRRARGYAPASVARLPGAPPTLALGAHYKNTIALVVDEELVVSSHIGDLDNDAARVLQQRTVDDLLKFYAVRPAALSCDLHPDYASTRLAERLAEEWNVELFRVQHHHAHIAAVLAETPPTGPVLGLAWDGTGLGTDGTLWGSEALWCEGVDYRRVAHLESFPLPGGDAAAREPRRSLLGLLYHCGLDLPPSARRWFNSKELVGLLAVVARGVNCPRSSSVGRLFDAVAALIGVRGRASFEGQAAMELETLAARAPAGVGTYPLSLPGGGSSLTSLCGALLDDLAEGVPPPTMARRFHNALIAWAVEVARAGRTKCVALTGGCFQNRLLADGLDAKLTEAGFVVMRPRLLPANDGQIAAGQAWLVAQTMKQRRERCA